MFALALRQASDIRRLQEQNVRLEQALCLANDTSEELARFCRGWKSRAESLWLIADPDLRDGVVSTLNTIDELEERT